MILYDLNRLTEPLNNPVLTIGNFDGVHRGHLALFELVRDRARRIGGQSVVMTFDPHPIKIMKPGNGPPLITPTEQKLNLIQDAGIEVIFCISFTPRFASVSAADFVKGTLVERIGIREIVVGYDYSFGRGRKGDISLIRKMGKELGFLVHVVEPIYVDHTLVSSTSIRSFLLEGNLGEARRLLGRDYQICGTVVKGKDRGARLLGYPTANLDLVDELIPKPGVYAVKVLIEGDEHGGVTNIGNNPTFGENQLSVETYVIDYNGDLLGKTIRLNFVERLRHEKTFRSVEQLTRAIDKDVERARSILKGRNQTGLLAGLQGE